MILCDLFGFWLLCTQPVSHSMSCFWFIHPSSLPGFSAMQICSELSPSHFVSKGNSLGAANIAARMEGFKR